MICHANETPPATTFTEQWRDNLGRCFRCGLCREVCPAFRALAQERFSPRGRLALISATLDGTSFGTPFAEALDYCLACRACAERCPSGVAGDVLVLAARAAGLCRGGFPLFAAAAYRAALPRPRLLAFLLKTLAIAQRIKALSLALAATGLPGKLALPPLPWKPFDAGAPDAFPAPAPARGRVLYFVGCGANYLYPAAARAVVTLLTKAGYDVTVPRRRRCCGIPALAAGDVKLARRLAETNVRALAGDEPVVVDCGSCGTMLTFYYNDVLEVAGAAPLKSRVKDFTQLLSAAAVTPPAGAVKIAYHDACHLARGLGVRAEPRAVLAGAGEVVEIEPAGGVSCCGGAGSYGLTHPAVYNSVSAERARAIIAAGADVVAAGCPACVFYLSEALRRLGAAAQAKHTAEILLGAD